MLHNKKSIIIIGIIILIIIGSLFIYKIDFSKNDNFTNNDTNYKTDDLDKENIKQDEQLKKDNEDIKQDEQSKKDSENIKQDNQSKEETNDSHKQENSNNNTVNQDNNSSNTSSNDKQNEDSSNNSENTPIIKEDKNDLLRKQIESKYGIKILYGDEIGSYTPRRITPVKLTEESAITDYLNRLDTELNKYPEGFFNDFNAKDMPLSIYLVKSTNGAFSGFTDYEFMNDIKITITTDYSFEYTLHHEMMHYIDCYLNITMYPQTPYMEYELLNPQNFNYGDASSTQIYNMATNPRGAYFISDYGSQSVAEDRAEVFKFMMARAYAPIGCFEPNETIRKKAKVISNQIKTYFPSVNENSHWDRFIK